MMISLGARLFNPWIVEWKGVNQKWWAVDDDVFTIPAAGRTSWITPYDPDGGVPHDRHVSFGIQRPMDVLGSEWRTFRKPNYVLFYVLAASNRQQSNIGIKVTMVDNPWYRGADEGFQPEVSARQGVTGFHLKGHPYHWQSTGGIYILDPVATATHEHMWFETLAWFTPHRLNQKAGLSVLLTSDFTGAMDGGSWKPGYEDTYIRLYAFSFQLWFPAGGGKLGGDFLPLPDFNRGRFPYEV